MKISNLCSATKKCHNGGPRATPGAHVKTAERHLLGDPPSTPALARGASQGPQEASKFKKSAHHNGDDDCGESSDQGGGWETGPQSSYRALEPTVVQHFSRRLRIWQRERPWTSLDLPGPPRTPLDLPRAAENDQKVKFCNVSVIFRPGICEIYFLDEKSNFSGFSGVPI